MEIIISKIVRPSELIFFTKIVRLLEIIKQKEVQLCQKGGGG